MSSNYVEVTYLNRSHNVIIYIYDYKNNTVRWSFVEDLFVVIEGGN